MLWSFLLAVLKVKEALCLQSLQIAASFLIFSHFGINSRILVKGPRRNVPPSELMITILPSFAAFSQNSTMSGKNWPSSMPMQSKSFQESPKEAKVTTSVAYLVCPSCVQIYPSSYRLSALNLTVSIFLPVISCFRTRLSISVDFPANMQPIMSSILPRCYRFLRLA